MDDLKIKFNGGNQIEANTLINSLLHFTNITHEVNKELQTDRKIEVKVTALREGSFIVHILLHATIIESIGQIFTRENIQIAGEISAAVGGIYGLAKFLRGGKSKVIESVDDSVKIENIKGNVTYIDRRVFNIYENNTFVRESISQEFATLDNDANVTGFEILDKNDEPIVQIPKEEFAAIALSEEGKVLPDEREIPRMGVLSISTLSFEKNIKWTFILDGNKITAKIDDEAFVKLIDSGEKFAKGDSLEAEISIRQQYDKSVDAFINKSYKISRIIRHIPRSEQARLDFPKG